MRALRLLLAVSLALVCAGPLSAQFLIAVQENGQVLPAANGGSITFNAPAAGQSVVATVTVTYIGVGSAVFAAPSNILGSTNFSGNAPATTLSQNQSVSFPLTYTPPDGLQELAQLTWIYNLVSTTGTTSGQTLGSGIVGFTLIGDAANVVVGQTSVNNNFLIVPAGGTFQFVDTTVNTASTVALAISNPGSGPVTIQSISTTGAGFQLQSVPLLPVTLAAGSQLNVSIQFLPASVGPQTGTIQIVLSSGTYSASLAGKGILSFLSYQILQGTTASPLSPSQTISFPNTNVGSKSSVLIQLQNVNSTAVTLSGIGVSGAGYSITDIPFLPVALQPQQTATITITFSPTAPGQGVGRLFIGNDSFFLSAVAAGSLLQFTYQTGGATVTVLPGSVISFPPTAVGQTSTIQVTTTNSGTVVASEVSIGVLATNGVFQVSNLPPSPIQIPPNGTSAFTIGFSPQTTGESTTSLLIDNQSFILAGFASAPPTLPTFHFTGASGVQQPFQQPGIGLSLDAAYPIAINGSLTITILSSSFSSDPAVQFSSGGRQVAFTIPANALQAVFPNGATQIRLQTGTVAGSLTIKPDFVVGTSNGTDITPASPTSLVLTVPSVAPTLLTATLSARTTASFSITITGYTTTRFLDHLNIQIAPAAGSTVSVVSTTIDVSAAARTWFQGTASQALGGAFTLDIPFTLGNGSSVGSTTDLTKSIGSVAITAVNDIGPSNTLTVVLP